MRRVRRVAHREIRESRAKYAPARAEIRLGVIVHRGFEKERARCSGLNSLQQVAADEPAALEPPFRHPHGAIVHAKTPERNRAAAAVRQRVTAAQSPPERA